MKQLPRNTMNISHHNNLIHYLNVVVAMERDIVNAVRIQLEDERVKAHPELKALFFDIAVQGDYRGKQYEELVEAEGGSISGSIKETFAAFSGVLSGLFDIARQHSLSHMVRDNTVAMNLASLNYGMLLTLATSLEHKRCEELARASLQDCPGFVLQLTKLLPGIFIEEISNECPVPNPGAAESVEQLMRESWNRTET